MSTSRDHTITGETDFEQKYLNIQWQQLQYVQLITTKTELHKVDTIDWERILI